MSASVVHPVDEDIPIDNLKKRTRSRSYRKYLFNMREATNILPQDMSKPSNKYILSPSSRYMKYWDAVMVVLLIFTATVTPVEVSFLVTELNTIFYVNRVVDSFFTMDMFINFFLAYYDDDAGQWVRNWGMITSKYLRSWFLVDLISILPFDFWTIQSDMESEFSEKFKLFRIIRLLRLVKLLRILRSLRIFRRIQSQLGLSFSTIALIKFIIWVIVIIHWLACLWNLSEGLVQNEFDKSWKSESNYFNEGEESILNTYLACVEVSIMFMVMSYGRFTPTNVFESAIAIVSMLGAGSLYAYVIGSICSVVSTRDPATLEYQQTMDLLNAYMQEIKLPNELRHNLRAYYSHCRQLFRTKYYQTILEGMSPSLRGCVADHLHGHWIQDIPFFNASSNDERRRFMIAVAIKLYPAAYAPMELIFVAGSLADSMFIVQKGLVAGGGRVYGKGRFFGEDMILKLNRRKFEVRSLTYVDVYKLTEDDLYSILSNGHFKETKRLIRRAAIKLALVNKIKELVYLSRIMNFGPRLTKKQMKKEIEELKRKAKSLKAASVRRVSHQIGRAPRNAENIDNFLLERKDALEIEDNRNQTRKILNFWLKGDWESRQIAIQHDNEERGAAAIDLGDRLGRLEEKLEFLISKISDNGVGMNKSKKVVLKPLSLNRQIDSFVEETSNSEGDEVTRIETKTSHRNLRSFFLIKPTET